MVTTSLFLKFLSFLITSDFSLPAILATASFFNLILSTALILLLPNFCSFSLLNVFSTASCLSNKTLASSTEDALCLKDNCFFKAFLCSLCELIKSMSYSFANSTNSGPKSSKSLAIVFRLPLLPAIFISLEA